MKKIANLVFNSFINDSRVLKESISLSNNNYFVEVIAHLDKGLEQQENKENFVIKRFSYLDRKITKSKIGKLIAYFKYFKQSINYCKDHDIIHCNDLNTFPIGCIIKKFYNSKVKIVYDAHEYETEVNGLSGIQKKLVKFIEKKLIKYADKVICVSDSISKEYVRLYDIEKPALILNTPAYKNLDKKNIFRDTFKIKNEKSIFLYQGGFDNGRGIEILLDAFKTMEMREAVIVFMGYGPLENLIKNTSDKYNNIFFHKAVSPNLLLEYTSSADFGLLFYENTCLNHYFCSPNKMFEYLMAEIPVIVSNLYEMKRLVEKNRIGVVAQKNTPNGLKKAIKEAVLLNKVELKENILKVKKIYNWEEQEKVLLKIYAEIE